MEFVYNAISSYLEMQTTGALLLNGYWGSGKTYHIKNNIFPKIESDTKETLLVSLYGVKTKEELQQKLLFSYFDKKKDSQKASIENITANITKLLDALPKVKEWVDIDKLILGGADNIFKMLPCENLLICFDDLERISSEFDINDFLGIVNELVENKNAKVLIIVNEDELPNGIKFKEKTIEKTIYFAPDISNIIDSLIDNYKDDLMFTSFFRDNKDFILKSLNSKHENKEFHEQLKKDMSNIRTIKFSIEHFYKLFKIIESKKDTTDETIIKQLKNIWLFTLAISIEFRKSQITFEDCKDLDNYVPLYNIDFSKNFGVEPSQNNQEISYGDEFEQVYYNRLSESFIFFPEVYALITGGQIVNKESFFKNIDTKFNMEDGVIHPAHALLNKFMRELYNFSDDEFKSGLETLLVYTKQGELLDIISYLNSAVYLIKFIDYYDSKTENELVAEIKGGIHHFFQNRPFNKAWEYHFQMVKNDFNNGSLSRICSFIEEELVKAKENEQKERVQRFETLFTDSIDSFFKEFMPGDSSIRMPETAIFHLLKKDKINSAVSRWNASDINTFSIFLRFRYQKKIGSIDLSPELTFLENIELSLQGKDKKRTLTDYFIETQLAPLLKQCKDEIKL